MVVVAAAAALAVTSAVHIDGHIDSRSAVAAAASSPVDNLPVYCSRRATAKGARHCMGTAAGRRGQAGIAEEGYIADIDRNWAVGSSSPRPVYQLREARCNLRSTRR